MQDYCSITGQPLLSIFYPLSTSRSEYTLAMLMNAAYLHLITVHIPVLGCPLALILLLIGKKHHNKTIIQTGLILLIISCLTTLPVAFFGHQSVSIVTDLPGVYRDIIKNHENMAEKALWATNITAGIALLTWGILHIGVALEEIFLVLTLVVGTITATLLGYTAHLGGKIRHPEVYVQETPNSVPPTLLTPHSSSIKPSQTTW